MRTPFAIATVLAAILAFTFVGARHDARYYTMLALADLSEGKLPGEHIASWVDRANISRRVSAAAALSSSDALLELASLELKAAGATAPESGREGLTREFREFAAAWPQVPIVQYRFAACLLSRAQAMAIEASPGNAGAARATALPSESIALIAEARDCLHRTAALDPENSLYYYELAYIHLCAGDVSAASGLLAAGSQAPRFDTGDEAVLSAVDRLSAIAGLPALEARIAAYDVSRVAPSLLGARMETLVGAILSEISANKESSRPSDGDCLLALEDLSDKLLQNADVVRQSQSSLIAEGLLWRFAARNAARERDEGLLAEARERLAGASYRYLLVGWRKASVGLPAQQSIVELDTPLDLRLDFSAPMQRAASLLVVLTFGLLALGAVAGVAALKFAWARQGALALVTLAAFAFLGYAGCFLSLASERARTADALGKRLTVITDVPDFLRTRGQPSSPAEYDLAIARKMLFTFDYTLQAARVLAYVGTRDCFDALIEGLDDRKNPSVGEIAVVLREATGRDFGYRVTNSNSANYEAVRAWRQWWRENRSTFPETPGKTG